MDFVISISEVRKNFSKMINKLVITGKRLVVTKNGHPSAVILTTEEFETLEIKADPTLMKSLIKAQEDFNKGRVFTSF